MSFILSRITSRIGAVVTGVDLTAPAPPSLRAELRAALDQHKALVFHDATLDDRQQQRVASWFGELTAAHPTVAAVDASGTVYAENGGAGAWHADATFVVNPPQVSTLRSVLTTPYGGETLIADAAAAYRDLPAPLRVLADSLRAVHTDARTPTFAAEHPVVRVHPLTGERGLFLGAHVQQLVGLSAAESGDVLRILQGYVTRPENVVQVAWEPDQLVIVDNRITQRYAIDNHDGLPRRLHRVTVAGEVPVGVDDVPSVQLLGDASRYTSVLDLDVPDDVDVAA